jgi:hypothetical protein
MAGKYPEAVSSRIFRVRDGKLELDAANSKLLEKLGLASAAIWSDLDGDGFPELIVACEWGPIRIFHNDHGHLSESNLALTGSQTSTFNELNGWWNGIGTGDLDGDGRLDIIAGNWGENSKYQSHREEPLKLYYGDFNGDGAFGLIESYFDPEIGKYVPEARLDLVARSMPFLRGQFSTYQAFADANVDRILGEHLPQARQVQANSLASTVFLNRGKSFEVVTLPAEAQFAPAFGVVVADFDGDGFEDVFLSQNFFAVEPETSRCDAGRGLWLRGDGHGNLHAVSGQESGVRVYGEQRGAAVADFDCDGRVDLVVAQNAAQTRLFRNVRAKPGLRVRLKGLPGNPLGYGVQMRIKKSGHVGPVREVHGGGGYWSQDSPVQVLAGADSPAEIWLRWPGGKSFTVKVPEGSTEVQVSINGEITRLR